MRLAEALATDYAMKFDDTGDHADCIKRDFMAGYYAASEQLKSPEAANRLRKLIKIGIESSALGWALWLNRDVPLLEPVEDAGNEAQSV